ncbi:hypothetical protein [Chlorogloea sp. CCALA 695]|uniref:hypothetical protein n=1 Tax=Chlorogloea sp. CCALA 695 TaxID=2107693 RepID=UPI0018EE0175|nr:hypothetical protein [Chlorogloea sp. CCALA 695]
MPIKGKTKITAIAGCITVKASLISTIQNLSVKIEFDRHGLAVKGKQKYRALQIGDELSAIAL